jgi:hypothetical protein
MVLSVLGFIFLVALIIFLIQVALKLGMFLWNWAFTIVLVGVAFLAICFYFPN